LRLSGWDSNVLMACELAMHAHLEKATDAERDDLANALEQVWDLYLPIGEQEDIAFGIGTLMFGMQRNARALAYFERSRAIWGPYPATAYNAALCHKRLGATQDALRLLDEALELDPDYTAAADARRQLIAEL
jgi:tetratricopeptide (TPR) repeat protein